MWVFWPHDPDLGTITYTYWPIGKVQNQTDARGTVIAYTYDQLQREQTRTVTLDGGAAETTSSFYDEAHWGQWNIGQLTRQVNGTARLCFQYDRAGRRTHERWTVPATTAPCSSTPSETFTRVTRYGTGGRVLGRDYPDGSTVGTPASPWTYDDKGRLASIPGLITSLQYNAAGQVEEAVYANGVTTKNWISDTRGWLDRVRSMDAGGTVLLNQRYTRDLAGRILTVESNVSKEEWSYGYDDLDRLTSADIWTTTRSTRSSVTTTAATSPRRPASAPISIRPAPACARMRRSRSTATPSPGTTPATCSPAAAARSPPPSRGQVLGRREPPGLDHAHGRVRHPDGKLRLRPGRRTIMGKLLQSESRRNGDLAG